NRRYNRPEARKKASLRSKQPVNTSFSAACSVVPQMLQNNRGLQPLWEASELNSLSILPFFRSL
ncbi:MAG: hypothetical protein ACRD27_08555, partial [Terracidiphilus sp.]